MNKKSTTSEDFKEVNRLIQEFDSVQLGFLPDREFLDYSDEVLAKLHLKYDSNDNVTDQQRSRIYELEALTAIHESPGASDEWIAHVRLLIGPNHSFISTSLDKRLSALEKKAHIKRRREQNQRVVILGVIIGLVISFSLVFQRLSDDSLVANADPVILALVNQAGMNTDTKLVFLRANPEIVDTAKLKSKCQTKSANKETNEWGCYSPSGFTDSNEHIYILGFQDDRLKPIEVVTAAHEVLHAMRARLDANTLNLIDKELTDVYSTLHIDSLSSRMAVYDAIEPGEKNNELHSILGTEQSILNPSLEAYYSKYFYNRSTITSLSDNVKKVVADLSSQLTADYNSIVAEQGVDKGLYDKSMSFAYSGNRSGSSYYYGLYITKHNEIDVMIQQYKDSKNKYTDLINDYEGKAPADIQQIQQK